MGVCPLITVAGDVQSFTELNILKTGTHIAILEKMNNCMPSVVSHTHS